MGLVALSWGSTAHAERRPKAAVMALKAVGEADKSRISGLSELVASELGRTGRVEVITAADIQNMIGFESQRQLLGCSEDDSASCLAEIGGALGVDYIVGGQVNRLGDTWLLTLSLIDIAQARPVHRVTERASDTASLVDGATRGARQLAVALFPDLTFDTPATGGGEGMRWAGVITGSVLVLAGGGLYGSGWATYAGREDASGNPTRTWPELQSARTRAGVGLGLAGGGAAIALASLFFLGGDGPAVGLAPIEGGGAMVVLTLGGVR